MRALSCDSFASHKSTRACVWSGTYAFLCISLDIHERKRSIYVDREGVKIIFVNMTPCFAFIFRIIVYFCYFVSSLQLLMLCMCVTLCSLACIIEFMLVNSINALLVWLVMSLTNARFIKPSTLDENTKHNPMRWITWLASR